jgi:hypothetical protein
MVASSCQREQARPGISTLAFLFRARRERYFGVILLPSTAVKEDVYMGILDELLGNGQLQKQYKDFVDRYEQGDPSEGYSDQEVLKRYGEVSHAVPPDQYAQAAQEALSKLSPEERAEFLKMLQERAAARGVTLPRSQLRDILGRGNAQPQEQAPGSNPLIDMLSSPMAKAVLAGIAAMVVKRVMNPSQV